MGLQESQVTWKTALRIYAVLWMVVGTFWGFTFAPLLFLFFLKGVAIWSISGMLE